MLQLRVFGAPEAMAEVAHGLREIPGARRAVIALVCGLATTCLIAGLMTRLLSTLDLLPSGFVVGKGGFLAGLSTVNISTPIVALVSGIAGILALETRASSAVGVAISVTTIPASA